MDDGNLKVTVQQIVALEMGDRKELFKGTYLFPDGVLKKHVLWKHKKITQFIEKLKGI
jgi:hypothetical protein